MFCFLKLYYLFTHLPDRRVWSIFVVLRSSPRYCIWGGAGGCGRWTATLSRVARWQCHVDIWFSFELRTHFGGLLVYFWFTFWLYWPLLAIIFGDVKLTDLLFKLITLYFGNANEITAHFDIMPVTCIYQSCFVEWVTDLICYTLPHQCKCFVSVCEILTAETCGKLSKGTIIVKGESLLAGLDLGPGSRHYCHDRDVLGRRCAAAIFFHAISAF